MTGKGTVHIVGIAGSGMCAVAEVSLACGYSVSGSDRHLDCQNPVPVLQSLRRAGCCLHPQDGSGITSATRAVVVSTAIEADNPDLVQARKHAIPILHRTEWLQQRIGRKRLLGIAGTSGKSTVTAMTGWILEQCGYAPFVVNGAGLAAWEAPDRSGQVRVGSEGLWVLELDESDRSLLRFAPHHAVITNISADHFPLPETEALFADFRRGVSGICVEGPWDVMDYGDSMEGCWFRSGDCNYTLPLIGRHNAANAVAAVALCQCVGVPPAAAAEALQHFPGVRRRLERCRPSGAIAVFDDFAHNPAKIAAALHAILPHVAALTVVWRPHGYAPLRSMMEELVATFAYLAEAGRTARRHRLLLLPVYDAGGTAQRDVQSGDLAALLRPLGVETYCPMTYDEIRAFCEPDRVQAGDAVLVMGARDPGLAELAKSIARQHQDFRLKTEGET